MSVANAYMPVITPKNFAFLKRIVSTLDRLSNMNFGPVFPPDTATKDPGPLTECRPDLLLRSDAWPERQADSDLALRDGSLSIVIPHPILLEPDRDDVRRRTQGDRAN